MGALQITIIVVGMILAGLGSYLYLTNRNVEYNLKMDLSGIVTQVEEKPVKAIGKNGREITGIDHLTYFSIEVDGQPYETARITRNKYQVGQEIALKCDPENRRNVEEKASVPPNGRLAGSVMMLAGMALLIVGVFII